MSLALLDWRRRVTEIYSTVRATSDPQRAHATWCEARDELLRSHPESPIPPSLRGSFDGARYAPYDSALRFVVRVETEVEQQSYRVETGTDGLVSFSRIGRVRLGTLGEVDLWWLDSYGGRLFLPVRDTSPATYAGGRYVLDTAKGADLGGTFDPENRSGSLVVDLNFAYQPSCAYDPAWACPLAPATNAVAAPVFAGELVS